MRDETWDYRGFHRYLWDNTDSRGILKFTQDDLAETFLVTKSFMSQVIKKFEAENRVKRLSKPNQKSILQISDPDYFTEFH